MIETQLEPAKPQVEAIGLLNLHLLALGMVRFGGLKDVRRNILKFSVYFLICFSEHMNLAYSRHLSVGGGGDGESFQEVCKDKENSQLLTFKNRVCSKTIAM